MSGVIIVTIVFGSLVILAGLLCGTVLVIARMRHGGLSGDNRKASRDEAMMIQDIYQGLERMEQRVEALETILMDGRESDGDKR